MSSMCGNYQVDENEECDVGPKREDMCCNSDCMLKVPGSCRLVSIFYATHNWYV